MPLTTSIHLSLAFLHPVANPAAGISCGTAGSVGGGGSRSDNFEKTGDFRTYANGVVRVITGTSVMRSISVALRALTPDQVDAVMAMVGQTCCFRDTYGRVVFGSFLITTLTDIPLSNLADVGITLTEVTYSQAV